MAVLTAGVLPSPAQNKQKSADIQGNIGAYMAFLEEHPDAPEADSMSCQICLYLAEGLNLTSEEKDFEKALSYARSEHTRKLVQDKKAEWSREKKAKRRYLNARERWNFGVGAYGAFRRNNDIGLFLQMKVGGDHRLINGVVTAGLSSWNTFLPKQTDKWFATGKFNLRMAGRINYGLMGLFSDIGAGFQAALPKNTDYSYMRLNKIEEPCCFHPICFFETGWKYQELEIRLGAVYDITPAYKQQMIYESSYFNYDLVRPVIDERFRYSLSLVYYFER